MRERDILWTPATRVGLEHLRLTEDSAGCIASSVVIGVEDGKPFSVWYELRCDAGWRVQSVNVHLLHSSTRDTRIALFADSDGHWRLPSGQPLPALDGCIDVDLTATPFTNTLPIRRLAFKVGQSAEFLMAYITIPAMEIQPSRQRYTCLAQYEDGGLYRYEGLASGFTADIRVDADGLVVDYQGVFRRV